MNTILFVGNLSYEDATKPGVPPVFNRFNTIIRDICGYTGKGGTVAEDILSNVGINKTEFYNNRPNYTESSISFNPWTYYSDVISAFSNHNLKTLSSGVRNSMVLRNNIVIHSSRPSGKEKWNTDNESTKKPITRDTIFYIPGVSRSDVVDSIKLASTRITLVFTANDTDYRVSLSLVDSVLDVTSCVSDINLLSNHINVVTASLDSK